MMIIYILYHWNIIQNGELYANQVYGKRFSVLYSPYQAGQQNMCATVPDLKI